MESDSSCQGSWIDFLYHEEVVTLPQKIIIPIFEKHLWPAFLCKLRIRYHP